MEETKFENGSENYTHILKPEPDHDCERKMGISPSSRSGC
jgi:hypothetical protein